MSVYVQHYNTLSSLGFTAQENFDRMKSGHSGISQHQKENYLANPFYAGIINEEILNQHCSYFLDPNQYTKLEKMVLFNIHNIQQSGLVDINNEKTLIILSSTKGNIDLLDQTDLGGFGKERLKLSALGKAVQIFTGQSKKIPILSNACISGLAAIIIAKRYLQKEIYDNAVVIGCDLVSPFTIKGFNSLRALSFNPCAPYDKNRDGINLGDAAAAIVLGKENKGHSIELLGGHVSNDANHISGPSRTGEGLILAIQQASRNSNFSEDANLIAKPDYINAHGTATLFNDGMEAIAFNTLGFSDCQTNSMKGFWGHTLGAAGVIETIASIQSMEQNILLESKGFKDQDFEHPMNILSKSQNFETKLCLKTASGFGGCNAALYLSKTNA